MFLLFRGSSAVERPPVKRLVVGSNPTRGVLNGVKNPNGARQLLVLSVGFEKVLLNFRVIFYCEKIGNLYCGCKPRNSYPRSQKMSSYLILWLPLYNEIRTHFVQGAEPVNVLIMLYFLMFVLKT